MQGLYVYRPLPPALHHGVPASNKAQQQPPQQQQPLAVPTGSGQSNVVWFDGAGPFLAQRPLLDEERSPWTGDTQHATCATIACRRWVPPRRLVGSCLPALQHAARSAHQRPPRCPLPAVTLQAARTPTQRAALTGCEACWSFWCVCVASLQLGFWADRGVGSTMVCCQLLPPS